jgi:hypothetical protein
VSSVDIYPFAAVAVALAVSEWSVRRMAAWIPVAFALSLAVGAIGTVVTRGAALFVVSGVVFGVTFAVLVAAEAASLFGKPRWARARVV